MWRNALKFMLLFSLVTTLGCTIFSAGPYVMEFRYDPSPTPMPLPSAISNTPVPSPTQPTVTPAVGGPPGNANLTVESVLINDGSGYGPNCASATFVDVTIRNTGIVSAPASVAAIQDYVPSTGAFVQMSTLDVPSLASGDAYVGRVTVFFGPPVSVVHVLRVFADPSNTVQETTEADNVHETEFVLGDLGKCGPVDVQPTVTPAVDEP